VNDNPKGQSEEQAGTTDTPQNPPPPLAEKEPNAHDVHCNEEQQQPPKPERQPPEPSRFKRSLHFFNKSEWVNVFLTAVIALTGVVGIILVIRGGSDTARISCDGTYDIICLLKFGKPLVP
jgi:hypothetical protein